MATATENRKRKRWTFTMDDESYERLTHMADSAHTNRPSWWYRLATGRSWGEIRTAISVSEIRTRSTPACYRFHANRSTPAVLDGVVAGVLRTRYADCWSDARLIYTWPSCKRAQG